MKIPVTYIYLMSSGQKKLQLVDSKIIKTLFSDLNAKNEFIDHLTFVS